MKKLVCVLTGARSEYGLLHPIMSAIDEHPDLELRIITTGMHLMEKFGNTYKEIEKDGFKIEKMVKIDLIDDTGFGMARYIGDSIIGISKALNQINPDIFLILGDRSEALAGTISAAYMNFFIAHVHGGDSSKGGLDESARHAITKFSHIHFPATEKSADRIKKLGEPIENIYIVGAPGLDTILNQPLNSKAEIFSKYNLDLDEKYILLIQHAVSTQSDLAGIQMRETLEAIKTLKLQTIVIYPNSDSGGRKIIEVINEFIDLPFIKAYKSLPHKDYLSLMKYCSVMVGNSSSGMIESSSFKIPVVNIGIRQEGRERSTNVIDVPHKKDEIIKAIQKSLFDKKFLNQIKECINPYGQGQAGKKIADILSKINLSNELIQKKIIY